MPFQVLTTGPPHRGTQERIPALDDDGTPIWEPRDGNVVDWLARDLGSSHGAASNAVIHRDISARVYLTDARTVVVSDHFAKGARYRSRGIGLPIIPSPVLNKASQMRAQHAASGTFLYGQMRHRWVNGLAYSRALGRRDANTVRIGASERNAFGERQTVILILHLDRTHDPFEVANTIAQRVIASRLAASETTDEVRAALSTAAFEDPASLAPGKLSWIGLPGSAVLK